MRLFWILTLILMSSACAPTVQKIAPTLSEPVLRVDGTQTSQPVRGKAVLRDGAETPIRRWQPEKETEGAILLAVHGFNDYGGSLSSFAQQAAAQGLTLYAYDQRGFGETPDRGIWAGRDVMQTDLLDLVRAIKQHHPNRPLYLIGLSMGGAVVMGTSVRYAPLLEQKIDGMILVAPAVWGIEEMNVLYRSSLWLAAHTIPWRELTGSGLQIWPSDNIEMLRRQSADDLVIKGARIDTIYGLSHLMQDAQNAAAELALPTLWLYGGRDAIVPPRPTAKALVKADAALTGDLRFIYYPDRYHMLLRDLNAEVVHEDIFQWIAERKSLTAPIPSAQIRNRAWVEAHQGNTVPEAYAAKQQKQAK